jgi:hypothetical protein
LFNISLLQQADLDYKLDLKKKKEKRKKKEKKSEFKLINKKNEGINTFLLHEIYNFNK